VSHKNGGVEKEEGMNAQSFKKHTISYKL